MIGDREQAERTLAGAGTALKSVTVGAGVGYIGWEALVNDKPVVRTVADMAIGSDNVDAVVDTTGKAVGSVQETMRDVKESVSGLNGTVQQANSTFGGISEFLKHVCGGNGADMFGNFFSNIGKGNVSGLSIAGLIAAALLVFGRFGWLGKIAGAFLAMMLIGNNAGVFRTPEAERTMRTPSQAVPSEEQVQSGGMRR